jgi:thiol-disulfide isomerase/thioredoxin
VSRCSRPFLCSRIRAGECPTPALRELSCFGLGPAPHVTTRLPPTPTPFETTPFETTPFETTPFETTPFETTPFETTPFETTPFETTPFETGPLEWGKRCHLRPIAPYLQAERNARFSGSDMFIPHRWLPRSPLFHNGLCHRALYLGVLLTCSLGCKPTATTSASAGAPATAPNAASIPRQEPADAPPSSSPSHGTTELAASAPSGTPSDARAPGWIGISMKQTDTGVVVNTVLRNGPAAAAGLLSGDRLMRINGQNVGTPAEVSELVQSIAPGTQITFDIRREGAVRLLQGVVEAKPDKEDLLRRELMGQPAPSISELRTVQGAVVPSWNRLRDRVVVLEFWASWCVACRALAPTLNRWHEDLNPYGVDILGVTMDEFDEATRASKQLAFPTFYDADGEVTSRYQGTALPTLIVVDKRGVVVDVMVGLDFARIPQLEQRLQELSGIH